MSILEDKQRIKEDLTRNTLERIERKEELKRVINKIKNLEWEDKERVYKLLRKRGRNH